MFSVLEGETVGVRGTADRHHHRTHSFREREGGIDRDRGGGGFCGFAVAMPQNGGPGGGFTPAAPPWQVAALTRVMEVVTFILMAVWVFNYLGGLAFSPRVRPVMSDHGC